MRSTIILLLFVSTSMTCLAQSNNWMRDIGEAKKVAQQENKPILMSFAGSDWCKPCIKLTREVFETEEFITYAEDNLVLLLLDFPRLKKNAISMEQVKHNEKLAEKYNSDGAFPLVVVTDAEGHVIDKTGYRPGGAAPFIDYLENTLKSQ